MAGMCGLCNIVFGGHDPRPGRGSDYVCYVWLEGGWGARVATRDGHTAMTLFGSSATNQPMEMQERVFPMRFVTYRYEPDSAGAGMHRGGFGVTKEWLVTHGDAVLSDIGDRETRGSWGWDGGHDSPPNSFTYAAGTPEEERVGMFRTGMSVRQGRHLRYHHAGGGGFGRPADRDPEWVLEDVRDELVSPQAARDVYRVAVVEDDSHPYRFVLDERKTQALRETEDPAGV
jgi:N-methylhydantoinase B